MKTTAEERARVKRAEYNLGRPNVWPVPIYLKPISDAMRMNFWVALADRKLSTPMIGVRL